MMIRLYLHPDLCKADIPESTKVKPGRASGIPKQYMRQRQTTHKRTAGEQRRVGREERRYASEVQDKPAYKCAGKGCDAMVRPPRTERLESGKVLGTKEAEMIKEGKHHVLPPGTVTAEMLPTKTKTGRPVEGYCPGCHAARQPKTIAQATGKTPEEAVSRAKAKVSGGTSEQAQKSFDLLNDLLFDVTAAEQRPMRKGISLILSL